MDALDRIAMLRMGNDGNTLAHIFLEDVAKSPIECAKDVEWRLPHDAQLFIPPKEKDRVIMFADNSGVYVHSDGFCTPMGADISGELAAWQKVRGGI